MSEQSPNDHRYASPIGGLPPQTQLMSPTDRAVITDAYTFIPAGVHTDIVTTRLPHWENTRVWVLARPVSGFATTFAHYLMEISVDGGSTHPEPDDQAEAALFVTRGHVALTIDNERHELSAGGFAYIPAGSPWTLKQSGSDAACLHWFRKRYENVAGVPAPGPIVTRDQDIAPTVMADTQGAWATTRFMDPDDIAFDMHITIVTLQPGGVIPFLETHVMEHGLYVLQGKGVYRLNQDWVEVESGDYMWLRAFCPQACYAGGPEAFRYLLYKDMHRHSQLSL